MALRQSPTRGAEPRPGENHQLKCRLAFMLVVFTTKLWGSLFPGRGVPCRAWTQFFCQLTLREGVRGLAVVLKWMGPLASFLFSLISRSAHVHIPRNKGTQGADGHTSRDSPAFVHWWFYGKQLLSFMSTYSFHCHSETVTYRIRKNRCSNNTQELSNLPNSSFVPMVGYIELSEKATKTQDQEPHILAPVKQQRFTHRNPSLK